MKRTTLIGGILIILGVLGFIVESVSYTETEQVADIGPLEVETEERQTIPITPIVAGVAVATGITFVIVGARASKK